MTEIENGILKNIGKDVDQLKILIEKKVSGRALSTNIFFPYNRIVFGAPGTGKSYQLEMDRVVFGDNYERVTFHPNYSYAQFVGTYKPVPDKDSEGNDTITYKYIPGPFMRVLVKAMRSGKNLNIEPFLLLIEEINRANVASVFGDVFQLLDRKNGSSVYEIAATEDMKQYLTNELGGSPDEYKTVKIPGNMYIWATMNSADQGVSPMDTAFKRRWDFEYIGIDDNSEKMEDTKILIGKDRSCIKWNDLRKEINRILLNCRINEDKLLGPYFISCEIIEADKETKMVKDNDRFVKVFMNKVLIYLYEDAAKQYRSTVFTGCKDFSTFSSVCEEFIENGYKIFGELNITEQQMN